jgi:hypothetical protein
MSHGVNTYHHPVGEQPNAFLVCSLSLSYSLSLRLLTISEHVEVLLGVYARQLSSMLWEIQYMLGRLESKREFVSLALASYRNRMVR